MKSETKKLIITIINIVIFLGNALISLLTGEIELPQAAAGAASGFLTALTIV